MYRIIIFGTGEYYRRKKGYLHQFSIVCFADNDSSKQGSLIDGIKVVKPDSIMKMDYDYICVMASRQDEIIRQLLLMGTDEHKILKYSEIGVLRGRAKEYSKKKDAEESDIVLFSHLMNYTGASLALLNLTKVLRKNDYKCIVFTIFDGPLKKDFKKIGVSVYEEDYIREDNGELIDFISSKDLIVCNTIVYRYVIEKFSDLDVPVMWWIHESLGSHFYDFKPYKIHHNKNLHVYGVGELAQKAYREKFKDEKVKNLLYMVKEREIIEDNVKSNNRVVFAVIGGISNGKGQDIFVDAIMLMPKKYREKCSFLVIGKPIDNKLFNELKEKEYWVDELLVLGELDHNNMKKKYKDIGVVISTSRNDTMPTVIVEAMMNKKCCIVSPRTGIASFIEDGENGILLDELDSRQVAEKMMWVINNSEDVRRMGKNGYEVYKNNFSEERFTVRVDRIISELIK